MGPGLPVSYFPHVNYVPLVYILTSAIFVFLARPNNSDFYRIDAGVEEPLDVFQLGNFSGPT